MGGRLHIQERPYCEGSPYAESTLAAAAAVLAMLSRLRAEIRTQCMSPATALHDESCVPDIAHATKSLNLDLVSILLLQLFHIQQS